MNIGLKYFRLLTLFIVLIGIILLSSCSLFTKSSESNYTTSSQNFTTYNNSKYNIEFKYPDNWVIKMDSPILFEIKDPGELDPLNDIYFYLMEYNLPYDNINTLEEFTQKKLNNLQYDNYNILISEATILSNNLAYKVVYTTATGRNKIMEMWTVKNNFAYLIMCMGEINRYSFYSKDIENMIDSIEIK